MAYGAQGRMEVEDNSTDLGLSNWWMVVPAPDGKHFSAFPTLTPWSKPPSSLMFTPTAVTWLVSLLPPLLPPWSRMDGDHRRVGRKPQCGSCTADRLCSLCGTVLAWQNADMLLAREGLRRSLN